MAHRRTTANVECMLYLPVICATRSPFSRQIPFCCFVLFCFTAYYGSLCVRTLTLKNDVYYYAGLWSGWDPHPQGPSLRVAVVVTACQSWHAVFHHLLLTLSVLTLLLTCSHSHVSFCPKMTFLDLWLSCKLFFLQPSEVEQFPHPGQPELLLCPYE